MGWAISKVILLVKYILNLKAKSKELFCEVKLTILSKFNFIYTWDGLVLVSSRLATLKSCKKKIHMHIYSFGSSESDLNITLQKYKSPMLGNIFTES